MRRLLDPSCWRSTRSTLGAAGWLALEQPTPGWSRSPPRIWRPASPGSAPSGCRPSSSLVALGLGTILGDVASSRIRERAAVGARLGRRRGRLFAGLVKLARSRQADFDRYASSSAWAGTSRSRSDKRLKTRSPTATTSAPRWRRSASSPSAASSRRASRGTAIASGGSCSTRSGWRSSPACRRSRRWPPRWCSRWSAEAVALTRLAPPHLRHRRDGRRRCVPGRGAGAYARRPRGPRRARLRPRPGAARARRARGRRRRDRAGGALAAGAASPGCGRRSAPPRR